MDQYKSLNLHIYCRHLQDVNDKAEAFSWAYKLMRLTWANGMFISQVIGMFAKRGFESAFFNGGYRYARMARLDRAEIWDAYRDRTSTFYG